MTGTNGEVALLSMVANTTLGCITPKKKRHLYTTKRLKNSTANMPDSIKFGGVSNEYHS